MFVGTDWYFAEMEGAPKTAKMDAILSHLNGAMRCRFRGRHSILAPCRRLSHARCRKADCSAAAGCNSPHASPAENSPLKSSTTVLRGGAPKGRKTLLDEVPQHEKTLLGWLRERRPKQKKLLRSRAPKENVKLLKKFPVNFLWVCFLSVFCQIDGRCANFSFSGKLFR